MSSVAGGQPNGKPKGKYGPAYRELWLRHILHDISQETRGRNNKGHGTFAVAFALSTFFNARSGEAWPSRKTLAEFAGVSTRTVDRAFRWLESRGYVRRYTTFHPAKRVRSMRCFAMEPWTRVSRGGVTGVALEVSRVPQEPYTEPHTEPHILTSSTGVDGASLDVSVWSESFKLATDYQPHNGASLVAKARNEGRRDVDVREDIQDGMANGEDLGYVLWRPSA
jgi:hypothetical protein